MSVNNLSVSPGVAAAGTPWTRCRAVLAGMAMLGDGFGALRRRPELSFVWFGEHYRAVDVDPTYLCVFCRHTGPGQFS